MAFWTCECIGPQEGEKYCPCVIAMYAEKQKSYEENMQELSNLQQELDIYLQRKNLTQTKEM